MDKTLNSPEKVSVYCPNCFKKFFFLEIAKKSREKGMTKAVVGNTVCGAIVGGTIVGPLGAVVGAAAAALYWATHNNQ